MTKVYDCFTFFNELEILSIRLKELYEAVHCFVIVEAPVTFQGVAKPLHFQQHRELFSAFAGKIRHIVIEDMPAGPDPWRREHHQREAIRRGLTDALADDIVVVSDADEIPSLGALEEAIKRQSFLFLEMGLHYYFLNLKGGGPWRKAYCAPKSVIDRIPDLSVPRVREADYLKEIGGSPATNTLRNAGWHLTWQLGVDAIIAKLDAFSHTEFRAFRQPDRIRRAIRNRQFFISGANLCEVPMDQLPRSVQHDAAYHRQRGHLAPPLPPLLRHWVDLVRLRFSRAFGS